MRVGSKRKNTKNFETICKKHDRTGKKNREKQLHDSKSKDTMTVKINSDIKIANNFLKSSAIKWSFIGIGDDTRRFQRVMNCMTST